LFVFQKCVSQVNILVILLFFSTFELLDANTFV